MGLHPYPWGIVFFGFRRKIGHKIGGKYANGRHH